MSKKYKAIKKFDIDWSFLLRKVFHILPGDELYVAISTSISGYYAYSYREGHLHLTMTHDQFCQILPYLERVSDDDDSQNKVAEVATNDHEGMIYNPVTDTWSWF